MEGQSNMGIQDSSKPLVLRYGSLVAQALLEKDEVKLSELAGAKQEIEEALGMTEEQILAEARKLLER